jgi:hypothetical protein
MKAFVNAQAAAGKLPTTVAAAIAEICDDGTPASAAIPQTNCIRLRGSGSVGNGAGQLGFLRVDPVLVNGFKDPADVAALIPAPAAAAPTSTPAKPAAEASAAP